MIKKVAVKKMAFPRAFYHKNVTHVTALTKPTAVYKKKIHFSVAEISK